MLQLYSLIFLLTLITAATIGPPLNRIIDKELAYEVSDMSDSDAEKDFEEESDEFINDIGIITIAFFIPPTSEMASVSLHHASVVRDIHAPPPESKS